MRAINVFFTVVILYSGTSTADPLLGLPPLVVPENNPQTAEKIALGRRLFDDPRFSVNGTVSCASCHRKDKAFTDGLVTARVSQQMPGPRNTPTIVNAAFYTRLFVDGRRDSLENQAKDPFLNPIEHGLESHQSVIDIIRRDEEYPRRFQRAFDTDRDNITIEHVTKAIASFERTLLAGGSPFDRYFFGSDKTALSKSAVRGLNIFRRKGNCANCHEITWNQALFTDNRFYNLGVGFARVQQRLRDFIEALKIESGDSARLTRAFFDDRQRSELGRFSVTGNIEDIGKFKTPTLRNIELTAPYMHDGNQTTLLEVVDYYDRGGNKNPFLDPAIFPLMLTDQEKVDLVAFLKALTSPEYALTDGPSGN